MTKITVEQVEQVEQVEKLAVGTLVKDKDTGVIYTVFSTFVTDILSLDGRYHYFGDCESLDKLERLIGEDASLQILPKGTIVKLEQE